MLGGDGSREAALDAVSAWPGHLQVGGGINIDNARKWLDDGASALIVTSFVFTAGQLQQDRLNSLVRLVGKQRLVLDLSCRRKPDGR
jgi:phosphoribosylformimino-5-aminoimidazole carboxamide ribotide isomerase